MPSRFMLPHGSHIGYVYLVRSPQDGLYKIGFTKDMEKRLAALRSEKHCRLELIEVVQLINPRTIERVMHKTFHNKRVYGEWFNLSNDDIEEFRGLVMRCQGADKWLAKYYIETGQAYALD